MFALVGVGISVVATGFLLMAAVDWIDSGLWRMSIAVMMILLPTAGAWSAIKILTGKLDSIFAGFIRNRMRVVVNDRAE